MFIPGLKIGPETSRVPELDEARPEYAEIWFNFNRKDEYDQVFAELAKRNIPSGLHYWGATRDDIYANFCYPDQALIDETMTQMKETIDIAARNGCAYVNIHPGNMAQVKIDFANQSFTVQSEPVAYEQSKSLFLQYAQTLYDYAKANQVLLTVETIPKLDHTGWSGEEGRKSPYDIYNMPYEAVVEYAQRGFPIANDFGHTAATIVSEETDDVRRHLINVSKALNPHTRLVHLGFIVPPYNGTDLHSYLDHPSFDTQAAIPNRTDTITLLRSLSEYDHPIWVIAEPESAHVHNYMLTMKLLDAAKHTV